MGLSSSPNTVAVAVATAATPGSIKLTAINEHFQCGICYGYITDATTITDCLHSFCKPCIFHFFGTIDHRCPTCNTSVKDVNESIRSDSQLQRLIYTMVPGLLDEELNKREKYFESTACDAEMSEKAFSGRTWVNLKLFNEQMRSSPSTADRHHQHHHRHRHHHHHHNHHSSNGSNNRIQYVRYIQCLAETPVHIIGKLIRNKHNVPAHYHIKLTHQSQLLKDNETLLEAFTSFIVDKDELFDIKYEIKKIKHRRSLKNIENKIPLKQSSPTPPEPPVASRATRGGSGGGGGSPSKRPRRETPPTERLAMQPLRAEVEERPKAATTAAQQLPSPTQSTSTIASSSSSSSSSRLKNNQFLKVKFKSSSSSGAKSKKKKPVAATSRSAKKSDQVVAEPVSSTSAVEEVETKEDVPEEMDEVSEAKKETDVSEERMEVDAEAARTSAAAAASSVAAAAETTETTVYETPHQSTIDESMSEEKPEIEAEPQVIAAATDDVTSQPDVAAADVTQPTTAATTTTTVEEIQANENSTSREEKEDEKTTTTAAAAAEVETVCQLSSSSSTSLLAPEDADLRKQTKEIVNEMVERVEDCLAKV